MSFLEANAWQRESLQLRAQGYDGFLVLVGLFLVLLMENMWGFDPDAFKTTAASDAFLSFLVVGTASGIFTILTLTMISLKLQRLMARDVASLHVHQLSGSDSGPRNGHPEDGQTVPPNAGKGSFASGKSVARLDRLAKR